jgi:hypothetical protein
LKLVSFNILSRPGDAARHLFGLVYD